MGPDSGMEFPQICRARGRAPEPRGAGVTSFCRPGRVLFRPEAKQPMLPTTACCLRRERRLWPGCCLSKGGERKGLEGAARKPQREAVPFGVLQELGAAVQVGLWDADVLEEYNRAAKKEPTPPAEVWRSREGTDEHAALSWLHSIGGALSSLSEAAKKLGAAPVPGGATVLDDIFTAGDGKGGRRCAFLARRRGLRLLQPFVAE